MVQKRLENLKHLLIAHHLDALIIDKPIDIYYLTGEKLSFGRLVVTADRPILFVDGRYFEALSRNQHLTVHLTKGYGADSAFKQMWKWSKQRVGFDSAYTTYSSYEQLQALDADLIPLEEPVKQLRKIKTKEEIELLTAAAQLCARGFDFAVTLLKENVTEEEVSLELELFWRKAGGEALSFSPHIAFGPNSAYPHYRSGKTELRKGEIILIDIGVVREDYHSDMTRVLFFGDTDTELEKIYHIVREAQENALALCKPGTVIGHVDRAARDWIEKNGYGDYFTHSLGHGVGLEIHELPVLRGNVEEPLQEGMVITIEPGIYLPGKGGVRLEDTIAITDKGYENLTRRPLSKSVHCLV